MLVDLQSGKVGLLPDDSAEAWPLPAVAFLQRLAAKASLEGEKPVHFLFFSNFWVPDRDLGPNQLHRDRRDFARRALKVGFGHVFVKRSYLSSKFRSPSATYPFFMPLIHEYLSMDASIRFVVCFSFCTRSSNLISVSQSLPNHEFFKNG